MPGTFADHFRGVVEPLFGALGPADGFSGAALDELMGRIRYALPEALQDFYRVVGKFDPILQSHHRFYPPGGLRKMGVKRVFCEENQVVLYWGYDDVQGRSGDPSVYQGINDDPIEWYAEPGRCSDFLTRFIYWQALNGGLEHSCFGMGTARTREAAATWPVVVEEGDSLLYSRGGVVFSLIPRGEGYEVQVAAKSEAELDTTWRSLKLGQPILTSNKRLRATTPPPS